jgi:hypothetical protein
MKPILALLLVGCAANVEPAPSPCAPPSFADAACFSPGGGVTRCPEADGSYWDKQPDGARVKWRYADDAGFAVTVECEVK